MTWIQLLKRNFHLIWFWCLTFLTDAFNSIRHACLAPLSIIIVGIGDADFEKMEILDGDDAPHSNSSKWRDIVQFVPFRNFKDSHISRLAKETLAEVPKQFLDYMKSKEITPNIYSPAPEPEQPVEISNVCSESEDLEPPPF